MDEYESLNIDDLAALTNIENRLIRLRKREAANNNSLCGNITESIEKIHWIRQMLQARFEVKVDRDL